MSLPTVAVIGRPNVGKSTLINRIASKKTAIVHELAGVTRDRNYVTTDWRGIDFTLIDTGGIQFEGADLENSISNQAGLAIEEADAIVFLVDRKSGLLPDDNEIVNKLRISKKPVLLVVNKVDEARKHEADIFPFYSLGIGEPIAISAAHGIGIGDLLDKIVDILPDEIEKEPEIEAINIAIVGRPNAGKSSLLNKLIGYERAIVSDIAGTTRDSVDSLVSRDNKNYRFIDTAGIRRTIRNFEALEYYSYVRTLKAVDRADVVLIIIDSALGITEGDQKIISVALGRGCSIILLANKWDLLRNDPEAQDMFEQSADYRLRYLWFAPLVKISVKTGYGLKGIYKLIDEVYEQYTRQIKTSKINSFIDELKLEDRISKASGNLKIYYGSQIKTSPPYIVFYVNDVRHVTDNVRAYFEKLIRKKFGFIGTPIHLLFRKSK